jgi:hypothetical protein
MAVAAAVARMATSVPAVQEPVEERAQQHQQVRQGAEDVGRVLGQEEEGGNGQKAYEYQAHGRAEQAARAKRVFSRHGGLLFMQMWMPLGHRLRTCSCVASALSRLYPDVKNRVP